MLCIVPVFPREAITPPIVSPFSIAFFLGLLIIFFFIRPELAIDSLTDALRLFENADFRDYKDCLFDTREFG